MHNTCISIVDYVAVYGFKLMIFTYILKMFIDLVILLVQHD